MAALTRDTGHGGATAGRGALPAPEPIDLPRDGDAHLGGPRRRRRSPGWVPNHHGAWAMITVPVLTGVLLAGPSWRHLPLLALWWSGYFAFFATGLWLRSRRKARYWPPVRAYWLSTAIAAVCVLVTTAHLVVWALPFAPLIAVTFWCSARRLDRSLLNDVVTVTAAGLTTAVAYDAGVGGAGGVWGTGWTTDIAWWSLTGVTPGASPDGALTGWSWAWLVTALVTAYFLGTVLYVKTNIRERDHTGYLVGSIGYHVVVAGAVVALASAGTISWWHAGVWALLAARAAAVPIAGRHRRMRPMTIGLGEIVASAAVSLTLLLG